MVRKYIKVYGVYIRQELMGQKIESKPFYYSQAKLFPRFLSSSPKQCLPVKGVGV